MDSFDFTGKVVVVTGGSRGIGYATVEKFLDNGAKVALFGSRQETAEKALNQLKAAGKGDDSRLMALWPDLTQQQAVTDALNAIVEKWGRVDVLINNAGISHSQPIDYYQDGDFENIMSLNVTAAFHGCKAVAPIMKKQGGGVILNTSSVVSLYGTTSGCGYPTSKFALNGLTKSLARELGRDHIRVNAVAPGVTETDMVAALPEKYMQPLLNSIAMHQFGKAEDVANAFLFLASDYAAYISGTVLSVDGAMVN